MISVKMKTVSYQVLDYRSATACCKDMTEAVQIGVFPTGDDNLDIRFPGGYSVTKPFAYCPWCGEQISVETVS